MPPLPVFLQPINQGRKSRRSQKKAALSASPTVPRTRNQTFVIPPSHSHNRCASGAGSAAQAHQAQRLPLGVHDVPAYPHIMRNKHVVKTSRQNPNVIEASTVFRRILSAQSTRPKMLLLFPSTFFNNARLTRNHRVCVCARASRNDGRGGDALWSPIVECNINCAREVRERLHVKSQFPYAPPKVMAFHDR